MLTRWPIFSSIFGQSPLSARRLDQEPLSFSNHASALLCGERITSITLGPKLTQPLVAVIVTTPLFGVYTPEVLRAQIDCADVGIGSRRYILHAPRFGRQRCGFPGTGISTAQIALGTNSVPFSAEPPPDITGGRIACGLELID